MSIFWQNSNNLAKKCSTTPAGLVHSSPAKLLDTTDRGRNKIKMYNKIYDVRTLRPFRFIKKIYTYVCVYNGLYGSVSKIKLFLKLYLGTVRI